MDKNGNHIVALTVGRDGECSRYGTEKGLGFLEKRPEIATNFLAFVGGMCMRTLTNHPFILQGWK